MPPSIARRTICSASASPSAHWRSSAGPKLIIPRHTRDTRRPVRPRLTYSMRARLLAELCVNAGQQCVTLVDESVDLAAVDVRVRDPVRPAVAVLVEDLVE